MQAKCLWKTWNIGRKNMENSRRNTLKKKMILASGSPRRRELLTQIGFTFTVMPSDIEENPVSMLPQDVVIELSKKKARDVWEKLEDCDTDDTENDIGVTEKADKMTDGDDRLVLSADTVVSIEGEILGKPEDEADAVRMLSLLSGKEHHVYTGVTMIWVDGEGRRREYSFYVCTGVAMYHIDREEIAAYVRSGEPMDKAGAYGVQGKVAAFIKAIRGEYSNVVGLPVGRLYQEMKAWDLL